MNDLSIPEGRVEAPDEDLVYKLKTNSYTRVDNDIFEWAVDAGLRTVLIQLGAFLVTSMLD